jgi:hypothetical protein
VEAQGGGPLVGYGVFAVALVLVMLHRNAARSYLDAYRAAHHGTTPGLEWLTTHDPDPEVEHLRVRRLLALVGASVLLMVGIALMTLGAS